MTSLPSLTLYGSRVGHTDSSGAGEVMAALMLNDD